MKDYIDYNGECLFDKNELLGLLLQVLVNGRKKALERFNVEAPISIHYQCLTAEGKMIYPDSDEGPAEYEEYNDDFDYEPSMDVVQEIVLDSIKHYVDNETLDIIFLEFNDKADDALVDVVSLFTPSFIKAFDLESEIIDRFREEAQEKFQRKFDNDCADAAVSAAESNAEAYDEYMLDLADKYLH